VHWCDVYHAVEQGCPVNIDELREAAGDEDTWLQEYCCVFLADAENYIPMELVVACESEQATIDLPANFIARGRLFLGIDIGRKKDRSVDLARRRSRRRGGHARGDDAGAHSVPGAVRHLRSAGPIWPIALHRLDGHRRADGRRLRREVRRVESGSGRVQHREQRTHGNGRETQFEERKPDPGIAGDPSRDERGEAFHVADRTLPLRRGPHRSRTRGRVLGSASLLRTCVAISIR
jgi:hypothetical protein